MALKLENKTAGEVTIDDLFIDTIGTQFTIAASPTAVDLVSDRTASGIFSVDDVRNSVDLQTKITAGDVQLTQQGVIIDDTCALGIEFPTCGSYLQVSDADVTILTGQTRVGYTSITSNRVVTLPDASNTVAGEIYVIKDEAGDAKGNNKLVVTPVGGQTIDGDPSSPIASKYDVLQAYSDGVSKWFTAK